MANTATTAYNHEVTRTIVPNKQCDVYMYHSPPCMHFISSSIIMTLTAQLHRSNGCGKFSIGQLHCVYMHACIVITSVAELAASAACLLRLLASSGEDRLSNPALSDWFCIAFVLLHNLRLHTRISVPAETYIFVARNSRHASLALKLVIIAAHEDRWVLIAYECSHSSRHFPWSSLRHKCAVFLRSCASVSVLCLSILCDVDSNW